MSETQVPKRTRPRPGDELELTIDRREFYVALAASTLALGFPETALQYSEKARAVAAGDADALLITACAKQSLALQEKVRAREGEARHLREEAEALFRETLTSDPGRVEAKVRLGVSTQLPSFSFACRVEHRRAQL